MSHCVVLTFPLSYREVQQVLPQSSSDAVADQRRENDGVVSGGADRREHLVLLQSRWSGPIASHLIINAEDPQPIDPQSATFSSQVSTSPRPAGRMWTFGHLAMVTRCSFKKKKKKILDTS